jgi:NADH:ubiquinone oxidoreductase subunit 6 (subunit J)
MQRAFDRLDQQENRTQWKWTAGIAAAFGVIMFALVALTWTPAASSWVSDAAQAELASSNVTPEQAPLQLAQPTKPIRTVRAE